MELPCQLAVPQLPQIYCYCVIRSAQFIVAQVDRSLVPIEVIRRAKQVRVLSLLQKSENNTC